MYSKPSVQLLNSYLLNASCVPDTTENAGNMALHQASLVSVVVDVL